MVFELSHVIFNCLKSTIKTLEKVEKCVQSQQKETLERRHDLVLVFLLLKTPFSVSIVDFQQVNVS